MNKSTEARLEAVKNLRDEVRAFAYEEEKRKRAAAVLSVLRAQASESHLIAEIHYARTDSGYQRPILAGADAAQQYALRAINEALPDILRLAELRLHAEAREHKLKAWRLEAQLDAMLPEFVEQERTP